MIETAAQQPAISSTVIAYIPVLLVLFLINAFVLWRRYQSRRALVERVQELEDLSLAGRSIVVAQLDFEELCQLIVQEADKIIDTRTFQLGFFERDFYQLQIWTIDGIAQESRRFDLREGGGLVSWVREQRRSLLVRDFEKETDTLPAEPRYGGGTPPRSAIFIPLMSGDDVLGVLGAQSELPRHFTSKHVRQLTIVANQAAAAIANGRLFDQERRRAAQISLISSITHQINEADNLEDVFERVVTLTQETFTFSQVNIFQLNEDHDQLQLVASSMPELSLYAVEFPLDYSLVGAAAGLQKTIVANDAAQDQRFMTETGIAEVDQLLSEVRAIMVTPLIVDQATWGVLEVVGRETDVFHEQEQEVLETLAAGVAIAIQKGQQLMEQRIQAWLTNARLQVARAISRSVDLDGVVDAIVNMTPLLTGVEQCAILVWDQDLQYYVPRGAFGLEDDELDAFQQLRLHVGDWGALDAVHVGLMTFPTDRPAPWQTSGLPRPQMLFPLLFDGRLLGVLVVSDPGQLNLLPGETQASNRFLVYQALDRRQELLRDISRQTAQAIERTQLRRAQQEEAWVNTALLQVADAVNSLIDLQEILDTIVRLVPMLVGVDSCLVLILNDETQEFETGPSQGISEMGLGLLDTLRLREEELYEHLRQIEASGKHTETPHYLVALPEWLGKVLGTEEARAVPLRAQGRSVGIMLVGLTRHEEAYFNGRRLNILLGIAQQAATAVVNNQLYKEAAERDRLEQELTVARNIQASLIPDGSPNIPDLQVASYWHAARQVSGDFYDFIHLPDDRWAVLIADVADKGMPAALFMAVSRTILRTVANTRTDPAVILARTNELILNDSDSDLFVTVFLGVWDAQTHVLTYANGGHNPPLLCRANGDMIELRALGTALGVWDQARYETLTETLYPDDVVVLYTDGITEAINEDYDEFEVSRLQNVVRKNRHQPARRIMRAVDEAVQIHAGPAAQSDDITMVVLKYQPPGTTAAAADDREPTLVRRN